MCGGLKKFAIWPFNKKPRPEASEAGLLIYLISFLRQAYFLFQFFDISAETLIGIHQVVYRPAGV